MTEKNINKTSTGESSLTGIGQREIKDYEVETSAECFDNCLWGHLWKHSHIHQTDTPNQNIRPTLTQFVIPTLR